MKRKLTQIAIIGCVVAIVVIAGITILLRGIKSHDTHYVLLEVNPKVEILTDHRNTITSILPMNDEAEILLIQENFIGMDISEACTKFINLCAMAGYINPNTEDNAIRMTVISGLTQSLEIKIYQAINDFFMANEIMGVIVENDSDLAMIKQAKKVNVSNANKLALINSVIQKGSCDSIETLSKVSNSELIAKIEGYHLTCGYSPHKYTPEKLASKSKLIDFNRINFERHKNTITEQSLEEFSREFEEFRRLNLKKFELDFDTKYNEWVVNLT